MDVPPENDRCAVSMTTIIFPVKPIALAGFARYSFDVAEVLGKVDRYNHSFAGHSRDPVQRLRDLPSFLLRLLREIMDSHRSLPLVIRARVYIAMILSAVYMLSPLDFIAEGILGLVGLLHDLIILLIFFFHFAAIYRSSVVVMEVLELCYSCGKFTPIIKVRRKM